MQRSELSLLVSSWLCSDQVGSRWSKMARHRSSWLWRGRDGIAILGVRMPSWRFVRLTALCGVCCVELNSSVVSGLAVAFTGAFTGAGTVAAAVLRSCGGRFLRGSVLCGSVASKVSKADGYPQHRWLIPGLTIDHVPQPSVLGNR